MVAGVSACSSGGSSPSGGPDGGPSNPDASAGGRGSAGKGSGGASSKGGTHGSGGRDAATGAGGDESGGASSGGSGDGGASSGGSGGDGSGGGGASNGGSGGGGASSGGSGGEPPDASPCGHCPSGVCLDGGVCAQCGKDADCHDATPRCDLGAHECVACLPGTTDNCADGMYCDGASFSCKSGCKSDASCGAGFCNASHVCLDCNPNGTDKCADGKFCTTEGACIAGCKADGTGCASNVCTASHECSSCVKDSECAPGHVCSSGQCLPNCGHDNDCPSGLSCCNDRCVDLTRDHDACRACGTTCTANQFCASAGCRDATLASVCDSAKATFLRDGQDVDDAQDAVLSAALTAQPGGCPTAPTVRSVKQAEAGTINPKTGQPFVGSGDMQVVIGGPFGQSLIRYLDTAGATAIYSTYDNEIVNGNTVENAQFRLRSGGTPPVDVLRSTLGPSHDFVLIETVTDPTTGTLMFAIDGFFQYGTTAGVWFFANRMLPSLSTYTKSYYVYEWTDTDGDTAPSSGDTFTLATSGP